MLVTGAIRIAVGFCCGCGRAELKKNLEMPRNDRRFKFTP